MVPLGGAARRVWGPVTTQVATPVVVVCWVHRKVFPMLNHTGWPPSGRPDVVRVAVRVRMKARSGLGSMRAVSVVGAWVTVWVSRPEDVA